MKLLALESSGLVASAAIVTERAVICEATMNYKKTHSQTLLPMVDYIVQMTEQDLNEIDAIATASGPGSFTGLRIGSATAKGLGLALNKPLVPVPTLEGLACNNYGSENLICPMMDARRSQVYTGIYTFEDGHFEVLHEQTACPVEDILAVCRHLALEKGKKITFLGDGVPVYHEIILNSMKDLDHRYFFAPAHLNYQRAAAIGVRGLELYAAGLTESAAAHTPVYLRKSQAERELLKKRGQQIV